MKKSEQFIDMSDVIFKNSNEVTITNIEDEYYKAYEKRYQQVYENDYLWSSKDCSPDVMRVIETEGINRNAKILEIGCGEGRDAIPLLNENYGVLAIDYSETVIEKCNELSENKYVNNFRQFDIIKDKLEETFDFIYSIAVIHMFVTKKHRDIYYKFIYDHLKENGIALIGTMGDGQENYESDISNSFNDTKRTVINNNQEIKIVETSCKIVDWEQLKKELEEHNLKIRKQWISTDIPEFNNVMCVLLERNNRR